MGLPGPGMGRLVQEVLSPAASPEVEAWFGPVILCSWLPVALKC